MGLRPTHGDKSALLRFIDSKEVTRDFRGSVIAGTQGFRRPKCVHASVSGPHDRNLQPSAPAREDTNPERRRPTRISRACALFAVTFLTYYLRYPP